jgi:hypothetical protein
LSIRYTRRGIIVFLDIFMAIDFQWLWNQWAGLVTMRDSLSHPLDALSHGQEWFALTLHHEFLMGHNRRWTGCIIEKVGLGGEQRKRRGRSTWLKECGY